MAKHLTGYPRPAVALPRRQSTIGQAASRFGDPSAMGVDAWADPYLTAEDRRVLSDAARNYVADTAPTAAAVRASFR